jgi:hypothetical protein
MIGIALIGDATTVAGPLESASFVVELITGILTLLLTGLATWIAWQVFRGQRRDARATYADKLSAIGGSILAARSTGMSAKEVLDVALKESGEIGLAQRLANHPSVYKLGRWVTDYTRNCALESRDPDSLLRSIELLNGRLRAWTINPSRATRAIRLNPQVARPSPIDPTDSGDYRSK